jgi:glutamine---fructose-6-phosphate transaminase (isomerizing)
MVTLPPPQEPEPPFGRSGHPFFMYEMIWQQPKAVQATRGTAVAQAPGISLPPAGRRILFVGIGTSFHAALASAASARILLGPRYPVEAIASFDILADPTRSKDAGSAVVFSQSGETWITVQAQQVLRRQGIPMVLISSATKSASADLAEHLLVTQHTIETAWTHTVSYTAAVTAANELLRIWGRAASSDDPAAVDEALTTALKLEPAVRAFAFEQKDRPELVLMGSGASEATVREGALKCREAAGIFAVATGIEEFLHGVNPSVSERATVIAVSANELERARALEALTAARAVGAATRLVDSSGGGPLASIWSLPAVAPEATALVQIVPLQFFAYYSAVARGINPDVMRLDDERYLKARRLFGI